MQDNPTTRQLPIANRRRPSLRQTPTPHQKPSMPPVFKEIPLALIVPGVPAAGAPAKGSTPCESAGPLASEVLGPVCVAPENAAGKYEMISGHKLLNRLIARGHTTVVACVRSNEEVQLRCGQALEQVAIPMGFDRVVVFTGISLTISSIIQCSCEFLAWANQASAAGLDLAGFVRLVNARHSIPAQTGGAP